MDPQAAWDHLLEAYTHGDWSVVEELAEGILKWLHRGGFPPRPVFEREMGDEWNRAVAEFACRFALSEARTDQAGRSDE
jgi:hypothetical protein